MGLRFRKSISLGGGAKINFGKTGASFSFGIPGLRKTIHTSGKVTTSAGIPGTGIYYTHTENSSGQRIKAASQQNNDIPTSRQPHFSNGNQNNWRESSRDADSRSQTVPMAEQIDSAPTQRHFPLDELKNLHRVCDEPIDWTEILISTNADDVGLTKQQWDYYHSLSGQILNGDIDTYLRVIAEVNPLDDLLRYAKNFEFGTDNPSEIEVEYAINPDVLANVKEQSVHADYFPLVHKFICSLSIRVARDMFSLLPVKIVVVHAVEVDELHEKNIASITFNRQEMSKLNFRFVEPTDAIQKFNCIMKYDPDHDFGEVK